jgi:hypothetical protein
MRLLACLFSLLLIAVPAAAAKSVPFSNAQAVAGPYADAQYPTIATDTSSGRSLVVWLVQERDSRRLSVWGRFLFAGGSPLGEQFLVSTGHVSGWPTVVHDPIRQRWVVGWSAWQPAAPDSFPFNLRTVNRARKLGPVHSFVAAWSRVLLAAGRHGLLALSDDGQTLQAMRLAADGRPAGAARRIPTSVGIFHTELVASRNGYLAAWVEHQKRTGLVSRVRTLTLDQWGRTRGPRRTISPPPRSSTSVIDSLALARDGRGDLLAAWNFHDAERLVNGVVTRRLDDRGAGAGDHRTLLPPRVGQLMDGAAKVNAAGRRTGWDVSWLGSAPAAGVAWPIFARDGLGARGTRQIGTTSPAGGYIAALDHAIHPRRTSPPILLATANTIPPEPGCGPHPNADCHVGPQEIMLFAP